MSVAEMFISSFGDKIACEPFETNSAEIEFSGGVVRTVQKETLTELMLVFDGTTIKSGESVFVRSDRATAPWAKEVFCVDELNFILVPLSEVVLTREHDLDVCKCDSCRRENGE